MGQKFESGSLISIDLEGPVIGDLKKIKIWVILNLNQRVKYFLVIQ